MRGKPAMKAVIEHPVEKEIDEALLPRVDVERSFFADEIVMEGPSAPEPKETFRQSAMERVEILQPPAREIVQRLAVAGSSEGFSPGKERLGVKPHRGLVQFRLA